MSDDSRFEPFKQFEPLSPKNISGGSESDLSRRSSAEARAALPFAEAMRLRALPLLVERDRGYQLLHIAAARGQEEIVRQAVRFHTGMEVTVVPVSLDLIEKEIFAAYKGDAKELDFLPAAKKKTVSTHSQDSLLTAYNRGKGDAAKGLAALIDYGIARDISDIHLTPLPAGVRVRARKGGELLQKEQLIGDVSFHREIVNRLKVLINAATKPASMPVDGSFTAGSPEYPVRVRVGIMPSIHGESVVLRILANASVQTLSMLGYQKELIEQLHRCVGYKNGLILICGATGSGKTTTLYSLAQIIVGMNRAVHTLEEPVERTIDGFVQTEIDGARGVTYERCLPAILRQDPDCIVLGELRDSRSANAIVQAALTGHMTLSSVHSSDVRSVFKRFLQFGVALEELSSALRAVVCQHLVVGLCEHCKVMDLKATKQAGIKVCRSVGCGSCDYTGYHGRIPVVEAFCPAMDWRSAAAITAESFNFKTAGWYCCKKKGLELLLKQGKIDGTTYWNYTGD